MVSIVLVDPIGTVYDGETISKRALGGSESATCLMAKELAKIGFDVTVYNNCRDVDCKPGVYENVEYRHLDTIKHCRDKYDVMISLRNITPFVPPHLRLEVQNNSRYDFAEFDMIVANSKHKVLWLHDTFIWGDPVVEKLVVQGYINEIFTLSDFHTSYITNCWHGGDRRNFEVLKNKIFQTRNGIVKYFDEVDYMEKDPNLFVYCASVSKGLKVLLDDVWPLVKQNIPEAKLVIVGGYYHFASKAEPDVQHKELLELAKKQQYRDQQITFTGILPQKKVAEVFKYASFFLFPGTFPETFGISALESLYYKTPLITVRFGALEETALESVSYFVDYASEPNSLYPGINKQEQVQKIARMAVEAHRNKYLHQQKMNACSIVSDTCTWDTIALQWKQHLFTKLKKYLPVSDYRKVSYINDRVHKVFGRRFSNQEEWGTYKAEHENLIAIITPFYNAKDYIVRCIESVAAQNYNAYTMFLIDDASTDGSTELVKQYIETLPEKLRGKFVLIKNTENKGAVCNQITNIRKYVSGETLVVLLDGDDALVNNPNIFNYYNNLFYDNKTDYAYGSCWSEVDNIPLQAQPYPREIRLNKRYREYKFNWGMPYPHLRVFRYDLVHKIKDDSVFKDADGNWFKAGGDNATFYNIIEQADPDKIAVVSDIMMLYNDKNPLNDYKVNSDIQNKTASKITGDAKIQINKIEVNTTPGPMNVEMVQTKEMVVKNIMKESAVVMTRKKILIGIPTAKNIETQTFKSIYDLIIPEGYDTTFQYFYGYNVDQVRNLMADWMVKGDFDYMFAVDYDISFARDTLVKLLAHDKDIVSGMYIQRFADRHVLEIFETNLTGGFTHIPFDRLKDQGLVKVGACGFGCVLIKKNVFVDIGYPQFEYKSSLDHSKTFSEDLDFCRKAANKGFEVYADTSILCDHTGSYVYKVIQ